MKSISELHALLSGQEVCSVDAHIHTHCCDGQSDMTVQNIFERAKARGLTAVILTPHFHCAVSDETASLYSDSDEAIFFRLREEINAIQSNSPAGPMILLSTEADILSTNGETSLHLSPAAEEVLDLVTPTVNYHPLLPLKAVEVTYSRCIESLHGSGLYASYAERAGGVSAVLDALYETEANALRRCPYPAMLGHFFAAHSRVKGFNWFGATEEHLERMKTGATKLLDACAETGAMVDLTGIHGAENAAEKRISDGFFFEFQTWFWSQCRQRGILAFPGSDAHSLAAVGDVAYYRTLL